MTKLALIGISIAQSRAPSLHVTLGELLGKPVTYELFDPEENSPAAFERTLQRLKDEGYTGTNVTFPFKQLAIEYASRLDASVEKVGASNTLVLKPEGVQAYNTDFSGFARGYRGRCGDKPAGKVLMIGAGGVGRAVAFSLFDVGATEVLICDLNKDSSTSLVNALNKAGYTASVVEPADIATASQSVDGLINCTPVGHNKSPGIPLAAELIGPQSWAFDAVYTPMDTEFLIAAHKQNLTIVSGFDLFFYQGLDAFEFFTGIKVEDNLSVLNHFKQKFDIRSDLID